MDEKLKEEILELLDKAEKNLKEGNNEAASENINDAKDKIDPIGSGSLGPVRH